MEKFEDVDELFEHYTEMRKKKDYQILLAAAFGHMDCER